MERIPAWHASEATRLVKTPKLHAVDTGLMCAVRGINRRRLLGNPADLGSLLETFVYSELRKQSLWVDEPLAFHHYRDKDKVEVDIVMESASGGCYGVEVKAAASLRATAMVSTTRGSESMSTSLAAAWRAVVVFPHTRGPSMTTAPEAARRRESSWSAIRGR